MKKYAIKIIVAVALFAPFFVAPQTQAALPPNPCTITSFAATPAHLNSPGNASLSWTLSGCDTYPQSQFVTGIGSGTVYGNAISTGAVYQTTTYTLTETNSIGQQVSKSTTLTVGATPVTNCLVSASANPATITPGHTSVITWSSDCDSVTISGISGTFARSGTATTPILNATTTYTVSGYRAGATMQPSTTATVTVTPVQSQPQCVINSFTSNSYSITAGDSAFLSWNTTNCSTFRVGQSVTTAVAVTGTSYYTPTLSATTTYMLMATGSNTVTQSLTITVNQPSPNCLVDTFLTQTPTINSGSAAILQWSTSNCTAVKIEGGSITGNYALFSNGLSTGPLTVSTTYTITGSNATSNYTRWLTVTVNGVTPPPPPLCTLSLSVSSANITPTQTTLLSWNSSNCASVFLSGFGLTSTAVAGSQYVGPFPTTQTYTMTGRNTDGTTVTKSVTINVAGAPALCEVSMSTAATTVEPGKVTSLNWGSNNCVSVSVTGPGVSSTLTHNNMIIGPFTNGTVYTYTIVGRNADGTSVTKSVSVNTTTITPTLCTLSIAANQGTVNPLGTTLIAWTSSNCFEITVTGPGISSTAPSGTQSTSQLSTDATYSITGYDSAGTLNTKSTTVRVVSSAVCSIDSFNANPTIVTTGNSSSLSWNTTNCTSASISGGTLSGSVSVDSTGTLTGAINGTTTYVLTASGANTTTSSVTVSVNTPATCSISYFNASPSSVPSGNPSTLSWGSNNCSTFSLSGGIFTGGTVSGSSVGTNNLYNTTTYVLTASGTNTVTSQVTVSVNNNNNNNYCTINNFSASPTQVPVGGSSTLYWNTTGCTYANVTGPNFNSNSLSNSVSIGPINGTSTYTINAGGTNTVNQSVTVSNSYYNQQNSAPSVTTLAATGTNSTSVNLNGYINSNNFNNGYNNCYNCGGSYTSYYFTYGTNQYSLYSQTPTQTFSGTSGNVTALVQNLQPNTTYYFQLVGSNSYGSNYGGVLSFVPTNYNYNGGSINAVTSVATNVSANSARLNGLVNASQGTSGITAHFEYGTSPSLGFRTDNQNVSTFAVLNYFDTITTTPSTTYYYRIVAEVNGQTYPGSTASFTTPSTNNNTVVVTRVVNGTGGGSASAMLTLTDQSGAINPGDTITYIASYQNVSGAALSNVTLQVILPTGVTFKQASQGIPTTNNTVVATLGTLQAGAQGTITVTALADTTLIAGNNLVTTGTLSFTTTSGAMDSVIAYAMNSIAGNNSLAGLALFGAGFFPNSLLGWILLIGILLVLIFIARYFYHRANAARAASGGVHHYPPAYGMPMQHGPMPQQGGYQPNMMHNAYPPSNLPH